MYAPSYFLRLADTLVRSPHRLDEAAKRNIGDADQTDMTVLAIEQPPGHRLIDVLEPVRADDVRVGRGGGNELRIGLAGCCSV